MISPTYDEVVKQFELSRSLGADYELREVKFWTVHCAHCGYQIIGAKPQTEKSLQAVQRTLENRKCHNQQCVSNGGAECKNGSYEDGGCLPDASPGS